MTGGPALAHIVRTETAISIAINAFIASAIIWLAGVPAPATLGGTDGLVQGMVKAAGLATLAMTLLLTAILRLRRRAGTLPAVPRHELWVVARILPERLIVRAIVMALAAIVILVPIGAAGAIAARLLPLGAVGALLFNIGFGALVGLTMTAPVVLRALADPLPPRSARAA